MAYYGIYAIINCITFAQQSVHNARSNAQFNMKTGNKYAMINLNTFEVRICSSKETVAAIAGVHRNTLSNLKERAVYHNWLIVPVTEE
jgi:hypothetical protein